MTGQLGGFENFLDATAAPDSDELDPHADSMAGAAFDERDDEIEAGNAPA